LVWCPPCRRIAWAAKREVELKPDTMPSRAVMRLVSSARPPPPSALSITPIFPLMKRLQAGGVRARQRDVHKTRRGMPLMAVCPSTSRCARTIISSSPQTNPCSNKLCSWYHCSASQPRAAIASVAAEQDGAASTSASSSTSQERVGEAASGAILRRLLRLKAGVLLMNL
jgi:hypothetical protein